MSAWSISELLAWRWAPCLGLVLGSVSFVVLAVVLIPDRTGAVSPLEKSHFAAPIAATTPTAIAARAPAAAEPNPASEHSARRRVARVTSLPSDPVPSFFPGEPPEPLPPPLADTPPPPEPTVTAVQP